MKIAWYTPFAQSSAIGNFSKEVVDALLEFQHEVTIVRSEMDDSTCYQSCKDSNCEIVDAPKIDKQVNDFLSRFDSVVYNVGNHLENHYYCLKHQAEYPGVTLLHDFVLHNLLNEWSIYVKKEPYLDLLKLEASSEALSAYARASKDAGRLWFMDEAANHPVLRFAMAETLGVVTHAEFYAQPCREMLHCPVTTIPLAFPYQFESQLPPPSLGGTTKRLITIGDVNVNKRCESVITALSQMGELSRGWQYRIIGSVSDSYGRYLKNLAKAGPHPVDVKLLGKVDDETLRKELSDAQAISCLRYPIIEGASASVILSLASGRPILVSAGGCYDDIPDELVFRVNYDKEIEQISTALRSMEHDFAAAVEKASQARQWATLRHSGKQYATNLVPFLHKIEASRPLFKIAAEVGSHLSRWNCSSNAPIADTVQQESDTLFGKTLPCVGS